MPKRRGDNSLLFVIMAPFVVAAVGLGLWVSISAMIENVRLARFSNEVLSIVFLARDMSQDFKTNDEHATRVLFERLANSGNFDVVFPEDPTQRGIVNPWGETGSVGLMLSQQEVRLRTVLTPPVCRRFLYTQAASAQALGITRIEARDGSSLGGGRLVYEQGNAATIDRRWIDVGCGRDPKVVLSVSFRLKG